MSELAENLEQEIYYELIKKCREDVNYFIEYVFKDEKTGQPVVQADIHRVIQEFIDYCWSLGKNSVAIYAPWGHGKTVQVVARALLELGNDTNKRIKVVCNKDDNAAERVKLAKTYIQDCDEFKEIFPNCIPDTDQSWGVHKFTVKRDTISKDPSFESHGILSSGISGRADILILDDVVDLRNAILQPQLKKQVIEAYHTIWRSRLDGIDGKTILIGTMWTNDDLLAQIQKDPTFAVLKISVDAEIDGLACEYTGI